MDPGGFWSLGQQRLFGISTRAWIALVRTLRPLPALGRPGGHHPADPQQHHDISVLHYDRDFDVIAEVTGQTIKWVMPPGTAD